MKQLLALGALAAFLAAPTFALEPVNPQPSEPLTYSNPAYHKITPEQAKKELDHEKIVLLDVRTPEEFATGHVKGAVNVPLATLQKEKAGFTLQQAPNKSEKIFVQCRSGVRSEKAAELLINAGYKNVVNIYGIKQWPFPLEK